VVSSETWTLIGVIVGAVIGFALAFVREYIQELRQKKKYLRDLLSDLEYNKKLVERGESWGYHTVAYRDAKGAKYLFDLPEELRTHIYDAQCLTSGIYVRRKGLSSEEMKKLGRVLEDIIPEFKKYLDC
jgi:hypothetical protein